MKLISLLEYVLSEEIRMSNSEVFKSKVYAYANFLKQPLTLQMFVPVDKHGVILEDLKFCCSGSDCGCMGQPVNVGSQEEIDEYYEAKERVLFKDCDVKEIKSDKNYFVVYHKTRQIWISWTDRIIDDFILNRNYLNGIELTDSAIKQLGL